MHTDSPLMVIAKNCTLSNLSGIFLNILGKNSFVSLNNYILTPMFLFTVIVHIHDVDIENTILRLFQYTLYIWTYDERVIFWSKCISAIFPESLYFIFNDLTIKYCSENKTAPE